MCRRPLVAATTPASTSRPPPAPRSCAVANGTITETGYAGSYGNQTVVTLEDGTEIWYCHQSAIGVQRRRSRSAAAR